ncbi:hypothetical protein ACNKHU_05865 [Shigella flexneri]
MTPEIATRLEYQWTNNIGDANTIGTCPDNGLLTPVPTVSAGRSSSGSCSSSGTRKYRPSTSL